MVNYDLSVYIFVEKHATEVDVLYVDYGNRERVKVTQLRTLPENFKTLPAQAICCALAEVNNCFALKKNNTFTYYYTYVVHYNFNVEGMLKSFYRKHPIGVQ